MSLVVRFDKDGKRIPFTKTEIERERKRRERHKRRSEDYKRKRREEKRLDRKNVRTPPGKPGVGIGRKVTKTKAPRSGRRAGPGFKPLSAAEMAKAQRRAAIKKLREEQAKKRPTEKKKATPRRKVPGLKPTGSGNRKKPVGILNRTNPVTKKFMSRLNQRATKMTRGGRRRGL